MTSAAMLVNYESSIFESLKTFASSLFSEIKELSPTKTQEREMKLSKTLVTYNELSSVLGALYGIVDSKYKRLASSLEFVRPGSAVINPDDVLTNYWEMFNTALESYITAVDFSLDEIKSSKYQDAALTELYTALLTIRNQFITLFERIEDLIELIDIHDGLTEIGA